MTPNALTIAALLIALLAEFCFALGVWAFDIAGAVLFVICGVVARFKSTQSARGRSLQTWADYTICFMIFAGITIGAYRRGGEAYLWLGAVLIFGCALSFLVLGCSRRIAAPFGTPLAILMLLFAILRATSLFLLLAAIAANIIWVRTLLPRARQLPSPPARHCGAGTRASA